MIRNESTTEIPVHLLFRDESGTPSVASGATVVGRRRGTGEQRRIEQPVTAGGHGAHGPAGRAPAGRGDVDRAMADRGSVDRGPAGRGPVERPGPAGAGWVAAGVGLAAVAGCGAALWWAGLLPGPLRAALRLPARSYEGIGSGLWGVFAALAAVALCAFGGLARGREGYASVLTLFGAYRGTVRRTGLMWLSPLLARHQVDVRLKHWRSEPLQAVDRNGIPLRVVVLLVWRVVDPARATFAVADHTGQLRAEVEAVLARVLARAPADGARDAAAIGDALTRQLVARTAGSGIEVFSVQPVRIDYAPEVADVMSRRRVAALDARQREKALVSVVDAVEETVTRLTERGLTGELDDYERKALVRELTVAYLGGA
ncbi:SPFH domain-containing protein [Streptomyces sp. NPDC058657]|uniref:SPFH domain-containing protein n=1 Tax=unclassified Streptomyces TaxID=2593676 RepID=UPI00365BA718